jgi:DUF2911 family protein
MSMWIRLLSLIALWMSSPAFAQQIELPRPSPNAKITQTVGLTDITVEYSSPGVKGRKIWGALVPYDTLWRAGANAVTKITFSKDVKVDGKPVPAGSYAFFVIPGKSSWTLILNKDLNQPGTGAGYKQELDFLRVNVKPQAIHMRERLGYQVIDFDDFHASVALDWEKVRVALPVQLDTDAQVQAGIASLDNDGWRPWNNAARYELESKKDYAAGLKLIDRSLQLKEDWLNLWTKAQLLAAKGQYKEAYPLAQRASELGAKAPVFFFADDVKKALADWKNK